MRGLGATGCDDPVPGRHRAAYGQRLKASGADLSASTLSADEANWLLTDGFVITNKGLRFIAHEGATRNENVPAVDLSWNDLTPWLLPGAMCSMPATNPPR
jgi:hypothetical protein